MYRMFKMMNSRLALFRLLSVTLMLVMPGGTVGIAGLSPQDNKDAEKKETKREEGLPLKPDRTISFTTDEGTWISLDISPDGKMIVFELLGDIYTMPFTGGEAKVISKGLSFDSQPVFSPDGKKVVFLSDRTGSENVWIMDADGQNPKTLTRGAKFTYTSPNWTPDGNYILASRRSGLGASAIWMYHKDGGSGIELIKTGQAAAAGPGGPDPKQSVGVNVSPDGRWVFFAQRDKSFKYNETSAPYQVMRFDRETGASTRVTGSNGGGMRPLISPDGKWLVYATRYETKTGLRLRELETGEERWLIYPVTRDESEAPSTRDNMPGYDFTPDGKEIVTTINGKIFRVDVASGKATNIPFLARVALDVAPRTYFESKVEEGPVKVRLIRSASQSPDGRRVAFSALSKLYVMDLPSGQPRRLTDAQVGEFAPVWSPDGRWIAYVTWSPEGGHIWKVASDGGAPQQLSRRAAFYSELAWSPDGQRIVVVSGPKRERMAEEYAEGLQMRWLPANGGDTQLIAPLAGGSPHFAKESDRIYVNGGGGLLSMRFDGTDRKTHVRITGTGAVPPATPRSADEIRVSPDGQSAFALVQNKLYLVTIPKVGADAPTISVGEGSNFPVKKISKDGGEHLNWSPDGKYISWSLGNTFFRQEVSADKPETFTARIEFPRPKAQGTVVLRGAKAITMKGDEIIEKSDVVVTDNRIAEVGPQGKVKVPAGAKIIDVTGKTIMPGLVDVHAHLSLPKGIHQTQVWSYLTNLAYGVTTTHDPQSSTNDIFTYGDMVETGEILGPRIYTTGPGVFSHSGLDDLESTRALLKRYKEVYQTNTIKQYMVGDRKVRQWVIMACKELGISPTTEGALDFKLDLTHMLDGYSGQEHNIPISPLYKDVLQLLIQTKTFYTPTLLVAYGGPWTENYFYETTNIHDDAKLRRFTPHSVIDGIAKRRAQWFAEDEYYFKALAKVLTDVIRGGGRVCLGSHGQLQGLGAHWELWAMQSGGMTTHEALRCATIFGAEAIGLQKQLGSLEAGKFADLIVLDKDPLKDIRNTNSIRYVMKNGDLYEGDTLDQIWPKQRKLEQVWKGGAEPVENPASTRP